MKNKLIIILSVILVGVVLGLVILFMKNDDNKINYTNDEIKFKDEYENLNGQELKEDYILKTIDIEVDNNIKYVNDDELINLLTMGTNVIYFGWADCNWCRSIVPTLIKTVKSNNINQLFYYDLKSLRNSYENNEDENKVKLYEEIIKIIGDKIESVFDENSPRNGEKKILAPTVVFIKNGEFIGLHVKSVETHLKSTDELNEKQIKELSNIYESYLIQLNSNVCLEDGC